MIPVMPINALKGTLFQQELPAAYGDLVGQDYFITASVDYSRHLTGAVANQELRADHEEDGRALLETLSAEEHLSEFGRTLKHVLQGRDFIDLGCCYPDRCLVPRVVAQSMGSRRYIGVDVCVSDEARSDEFIMGPFDSFFVRNDLLGFLARLGPLDGAVFYISGMEPRYSKRGFESYIHACLEEMARVTKPGDAIVIGKGTTDFAPEDYGFKHLMRSDGSTDQIIYIKQPT